MKSIFTYLVILTIIAPPYAFSRNLVKSRFVKSKRGRVLVTSIDRNKNGSPEVVSLKSKKFFEFLHDRNNDGLADYRELGNSRYNIKFYNQYKGRFNYLKLLKKGKKRKTTLTLRWNKKKKAYKLVSAKKEKYKRLYASPAQLAEDCEDEQLSNSTLRETLNVITPVMAQHVDCRDIIIRLDKADKRGLAGINQDKAYSCIENQVLDETCLSRPRVAAHRVKGIYQVIDKVLRNYYRDSESERQAKILKLQGMFYVKPLGAEKEFGVGCEKQADFTEVIKGKGRMHPEQLFEELFRSQLEVISVKEISPEESIRSEMPEAYEKTLSLDEKCRRLMTEPEKGDKATVMACVERNVLNASCVVNPDFKDDTKAISEAIYKFMGIGANNSASYLNCMKTNKLDHLIAKLQPIFLSMISGSVGNSLRVKCSHNTGTNSMGSYSEMRNEITFDKKASSFGAKTHNEKVDYYSKIFAHEMYHAAGETHSGGATDFVNLLDNCCSKSITSATSNYKGTFSKCSSTDACSGSGATCKSVCTDCQALQGSLDKEKIVMQYFKMLNSASSGDLGNLMGEMEHEYGYNKSLDMFNVLTHLVSKKVQTQVEGVCKTNPEAVTEAVDVNICGLQPCTEVYTAIDISGIKHTGDNDVDTCINRVTAEVNECGAHSDSKSKDMCYRRLTKVYPGINCKSFSTLSQAEYEKSCQSVADAAECKGFANRAFEILEMFKFYDDVSIIKEKKEDKSLIAKIFEYVFISEACAADDDECDQQYKSNAASDPSTVVKPTTPGGDIDMKTIITPTNPDVDGGVDKPVVIPDGVEPDKVEDIAMIKASDYRLAAKREKDGTNLLDKIHNTFVDFVSTRQAYAAATGSSKESKPYYVKDLFPEKRGVESSFGGTGSRSYRQKRKYGRTGRAQVGKLGSPAAKAGGVSRYSKAGKSAGAASAAPGGGKSYRGSGGSRKRAGGSYGGSSYGSAGGGTPSSKYGPSSHRVGRRSLANLGKNNYLLAIKSVDQLRRFIRGDYKKVLKALQNPTFIAVLKKYRFQLKVPILSKRKPAKIEKYQGFGAKKPKEIYRLKRNKFVQVK